MKRTPYQHAVLFERIITNLFYGTFLCGLLSTFDSHFVFGLFGFLIASIFTGILYGLINCPACGRPISWRKSRFEALAKRCRGCGVNLDQ